jgi:electron transport complex protein RnfA
MSYVGIIITFVFINNFIFTQFLGLCPFIGVSKKMDSAVGMGFAVVFVMTVASFVTSLISSQILIPLKIEYLQIISFILVIAALVQFVEMVIRKISPDLYKALGIYLPLITTNCAVLGIAFICVKNEYNVLESVVAGFSAGLGFTLAIILMSSIREKLDMEKVPQALRGAPIAFISAGLMALGFMAFDMAILKNIFG